VDNRLKGQGIAPGSSGTNSPSGIRSLVEPSIFTTSVFFVIGVTALLRPGDIVHGIKSPVGRKNMITIRNAVIAALGFALLALPSAAFAGFKPSAALQSACRGDAFRLCSGSLTSMESVGACLRAKKSQASPACQAQYDAESKATAQK
jgi:hypothetical protein